MLRARFGVPFAAGGRRQRRVTQMPTIVIILRDLWRTRRAVVVLCVVAMLAGLAVAYRVSFPPRLESRQHQVGVATASVLVDTPTSQVIEVAPKGSDTLAARATLLASLMVDGVVKDAIARRAGLRPDQLEGISSSATADTSKSTPDGDAYTLTTQVVSSSGGDQLPIVQIQAQAPDATAAGKLADAAVTGIRDYLNSRAGDVPETQRLRVSGLGPAQAGTVVRGPGGRMAFAVMVVLFGFGCAVLVIARAIARDWRAASAGGELLVVEDEVGGDGAVPLTLAPEPQPAESALRRPPGPDPGQGDRLAPRGRRTSSAQRENGSVTRGTKAR